MACLPISVVNTIWGHHRKTTYDKLHIIPCTYIPWNNSPLSNRIGNRNLDSWLVAYNSYRTFFLDLHSRIYSFPSIFFFSEIKFLESAFHPEIFPISLKSIFPNLIFPSAVESNTSKYQQMFSLQCIIKNGSECDVFSSYEVKL